MKKQNGITLIALIITIIVMLILVGVTINVALNGGLFTTAEDAVKQTQLEADKEQLMIAAIAAMETDGTLNTTKLNDNLPEGFTHSNGIYTSPSGNKLAVDNNGNVSLYKTIEQVIAEINADITNNPSEWQGLDDTEGETGKKLLNTCMNNNIILPDDPEEDRVLTEENNIVIIKWPATYYGERIELKVTLERHAEDEDMLDIKSFEATKIESLGQVIDLMNRTISSNKNNYYGTEEQVGEKLMALMEENNITLEQGYDGDYMFFGEDYIIIPADISYYDEDAKVSVRYEEDANNENNYYVTEIGFLPSIEEVIASINTDISENPTGWQGLNHSAGETATKLTSVFNEKYIEATETLNQAEITTSGEITTIAIDVKYFGEPTKIFIDTKQDATTKLYDVISFRLPVSIQAVIAEINADIVANPEEYKGFDDTEGETRDKLQSIFDENDIVKLEDFEDGEMIQEGNIITIIVDATYYEIPVKISIVVEQNEDIMDILSFGVV